MSVRRVACPVACQGERAYRQAQGLLQTAPAAAEGTAASSGGGAGGPGGWLSVAGSLLVGGGQAASARVGAVVGAVGGRASDAVGRFTLVTFPVTSFAYKRIKGLVNDVPGASQTPADTAPAASTSPATVPIGGGGTLTADVHVHVEAHVDGAKASAGRTASPETRLGRMRRLASYAVGVIPILQVVPAVVRWSQQVQTVAPAADEITTWVAGAAAGENSPPLAHLGDSERYYELWKDRDETSPATPATLPQQQVPPSGPPSLPPHLPVSPLPLSPLHRSHTTHLPLIAPSAHLPPLVLAVAHCLTVSLSLSLCLSV